MLGEWLIQRFVATPEGVSDPRARERYGVLEGWVSVVVNLVVFAVKLIPGLAIGSIALIADAFHSLGDVASSGVVIWGFKAAARPSDREHPFGHGRLESVVTLVIALLLLLTAWEFGKVSVDRLLHPRLIEAPLWLLAVLVVTIFLKEWLARFSLSLGRRISSGALVADSWHHRSDALSTVIVIAALLAARLGWWWVDGVGGLLVCGFVGWAAVQLIRESVSPLIGEAPSLELLDEIRGLAAGVDGVHEVHDIIVHSYGGLVVTSLHVEVAADLDISRGHEIAEAVEEKLVQRLSGWAVVHVDPVDRNHPLWGEVEAFLAEKMPQLPGNASFHDLRIVGARRPCFVIFDLKSDRAEAEATVRHLRAAVTARFPDVSKVVINQEPRFVY